MTEITMLNGKQVAEMTGLPYDAALKVMHKHGTKIGNVLYISFGKLEKVLNGEIR